MFGTILFSSHDPCNSLNSIWTGARFLYTISFDVKFEEDITKTTNSCWKFKPLMTRITWKSQSPFPTFYGVPIKNLCLDFSYVILIMFLKKKLAKHNCKHEFQLRFCFFSVIMCIHSIAIPNRPCKIGYPAWMSVRTKRNKKKNCPYVHHFWQSYFHSTISPKRSQQEQNWEHISNVSLIRSSNA